MPIYISRGRFTSDAVKGMLAKPEDREEAVGKLFKSVGGKLIGWYLTFGRHDWLVIGEFPDEKAAASAILAAAAGGSLSEIETTVAMTAKDAAATFEVRRKGGQELPERRTLVGSGEGFGVNEVSAPVLDTERLCVVRRPTGRIVASSSPPGGPGLSLRHRPGGLDVPSVPLATCGDLFRCEAQLRPPRPPDPR